MRYMRGERTAPVSTATKRSCAIAAAAPASSQPLTTAAAARAKTTMVCAECWGRTESEDTGSDRCRRRAQVWRPVFVCAGNMSSTQPSPTAPVLRCPVGLVCNEGQGDRPGGQADKGQGSHPLNVTPWRAEWCLCVSHHADARPIAPLAAVPSWKTARVECNIRKGGNPESRCLGVHPHAGECLKRADMVVSKK